MASISCTLDESLPITDWVARAHKVSDGALVGTSDVTSSPFSVTTSTTEPCYVTMTPKMGARWSASSPKVVDDYGYPTDLSATPRLYKVTDSVTGDTRYSNVSLLLHCDGANGSTTFTDNSPTPKTVTAVGNAQISTAQSKFGGASAAFDGTGDYITLASDDAWAFGSGDFTIECWLYLPTAGGLQSKGLFTRRVLGAGYSPFHVDISSNVPRFLACTSEMTWDVAVSGTALSYDTWHHIAAVRSGTSFKLYVDGSSVGTPGSEASALMSVTNSLYIASDGGGGSLNGYLDDIRITKGVARYTENFTPPTAPHLNAANGQTGASEPTWPTSGTVVDGSVTWTLVGDLVQPIAHGPLIPS